MWQLVAVLWGAAVGVSANGAPDGVDGRRNMVVDWAADPVEALQRMGSKQRAATMATAMDTMSAFLEEHAVVAEVGADCVMANLTATTPSAGCSIDKAVHTLLGTATRMFEGRYGIHMSTNAVESESDAPARLADHLPVLLELDAQRTTKFSDFVHSNMIPETKPLRANQLEMSALFTWAAYWGMELSIPELAPFFTMFKQYGILPTPKKHKIKPPCINGDIDVKDKEDHQCEFYENNVAQCGLLDTDDFIADDLCCDCKDSATPLSERPDFLDMSSKWRIIHDVYGKFEVWKGVWAPVTPRETASDPNSVCRDWLPMIHRFYTKNDPSRDWKCENNPQSRMKDVHSIFAVTGIPAALASGSPGTVSTVEIREDMNKAFGLPAACKKDGASAECTEAKKKEESLINAVLDKDKSLQALDTVHIRDSIFSIWTKRDEIFSYFCQSGPSKRLEQLFDMPEGRGDFKADGAATYYVLPDTDLQMCWQIMETALLTEIDPTAHAYTVMRLVIKTAFHWMLLVLFLRVTHLYYITLTTMQEYPLVCPDLMSIFDNTTFQTLQCSNGNSVGSTCFAICRPGVGEGADGMVRALHTYCDQHGNWNDPYFRFSCTTTNQDVEAGGAPPRIFA